MSVTIQNLHQTLENRRTTYALNDTLSVPKQTIVDMVEHTMLYTPSAKAYLIFSRSKINNDNC